MGQVQIYVNLLAGLVFKALLDADGKMLRCVGGSHEMELLEFDHIKVDGVVYRMEDFDKNLYVLVEVA